MAILASAKRLNRGPSRGHAFHNFGNFGKRLPEHHILHEKVLIHFRYKVPMNGPNLWHRVSEFHNIGRNLHKHNNHALVFFQIYMEVEKKIFLYFLYNLTILAPPKDM